MCSEVFEHTSIIQFIERRFGIHCPNISAWRRAICGDLTSAFDFNTRDMTWPLLPNTGLYVSDANRQCSSLPEPTVPTICHHYSHDTRQRRCSRRIFSGEKIS